MATVKELLQNTQSIAVIGLSDNPMRASYEVAEYLQQFYDIYPVNPNVSSVLGLTSYPDLASIPVDIDMVDVFQRSENVMQFVAPAIDKGVQSFWMQLGISNAEARAQLESAGISVVEDLCTKVEHARLIR